MNDYWKVIWKVLVDGVDMTSGMRPYLIDIEVTDKEGTSSDTCSLTFDDNGGQIELPRDGALIEIFLQGVSIFKGTLDSVRSSGSRGGGRTLRVTAKGFDSRGKVKQPLTFHRDDATLQEFLDDAAKRAGLASVKLDPQFAKIHRAYWAADGESYIHIGERIARELGGTFKIRGDQSVLARRGEGKAATGAALPVIIGIVGQNIISWDIAPFKGRHTFTKAKVRYFDRKDASFKSKDVEFDLDRDLPESTNVVRSMAADEDQAGQIGDARKREAERDGGEGNVELVLTVEARAEGTFNLTGARAGVDGQYRIISVRHKADRSGGATTSLELKQPGGSAGKDNRKKKTKPSPAKADNEFSEMSDDPLED
ncbi:late control D family protein [Brucella anthropi]|uniref:phage late control D family protein n=1 Tax=Brucella anthropi TaxID=529 RepID=UPI00044F2CCC|nr:late control D family protein [Brucella anthropi]EXL07432.1 late control D family protein [Brucella anthropi]RRY13325.1 late control D family protein [Brucella anthropi]